MANYRLNPQLMLLLPAGTLFPVKVSFAIASHQTTMKAVRKYVWFLRLSDHAQFLHQLAKPIRAKDKG